MRTQPTIARASRIGRVDMNFDCHLVHGDRCCTRAVGKATYVYIYILYIYLLKDLYVVRKSMETVRGKCKWVNNSTPDRVNIDCLMSASQFTPQVDESLERFEWLCS